MSTDVLSDDVIQDGGNTLSVVELARNFIYRQQVSNMATEFQSQCSS